jgi:hypothetical protein
LARENVLSSLHKAGTGLPAAKAPPVTAAAPAAAPAAPAPAASPFPKPSAEDISFLKANPDVRKLFEKRFGPADQYLQ